MDKKKAVKLATASAIAASAFVAANPAASEAATNVAAVVSNAKAQMKQAYYTYSQVTETGEFADIKDVYAAYNKAKKAYNDAVALVKKAGGKQKDAYLADLEATYKEYITKRVVTYIDAYNYAVKLDEMRKELEAAVQAKDIAKAEELYHQISRELKSRTVILDRVYGKTTRDLLRSTFKAEAQELRDSLVYDITVSMKLRAAQEATDKGDLTAAEAALAAAKDALAKATAFKAELTSEEAKVRAAYEAKLTPAVVSVSAINAAQLQVKFNKAVDKNTVVDTDGTLKNGVLTVTKVSGTGTVTVNDSSLATLSEDGKTLTVTAATGAFNNINFVVTTTEDTIKTTDGKYVPKYTSNVLVSNDTTAPIVTNVEKRTASTVRVYFSEPLLNEGSWTFKFADGTAANVTVDASNRAKGYVDLTIDAGIQAGKEITATVIGAKDYAGNLVNPNPFTVNFSKGQLDGVKPTVSSLTTNGLTTFEVKFSEEVQGFTAADISIDGVARTADDGNGVATGTEAIVTQDTTDKTKYTVTVAQQSAGLHTIAIAANAVTDLSGEQNETYSKVVEFKADTTAPKLVSSQVKKDENGYEYLHLTFDEAVTKGALNALTATRVKDYITTTDTINLSTATAVPNTGNKEYKVKLADVTFAGAALEAGATYTVTLTGGFSDSSSNALETTKVSFVRGTDSLTVAQSVSSVTKVANKPSEVKVTFAQPVDGATATNVANYNISGVVIEKAEIRAGELNVVYLTLKEGSNTLSGERNVTINGVKTKDGVAMTTAYTGTVSLDENVAPTFTAALTSADTITLKFSEGVLASKVGAGDLDVFVGTTKESETGSFAITPVNTDANGYATEFTIKLADVLKPEEFAQTITVEAVLESGNEIVDAKGNFVKVGKVTVTK
jgi:hypothetical protein